MNDIKAQLDSLQAFPDALKRQVYELDLDALRFRPAPGAWSILEIVGHLIDIEALFSGRVRQILAADNPALTTLDVEAAVRERDYQNKQLGFLLLTFAERRGEHLELLRVLRPQQLARSGLHPVRGAMSVADCIGILARHDHEHAAQIAANLRASGHAQV